MCAPACLDSRWLTLECSSHFIPHPMSALDQFAFYLGIIGSVLTVIGFPLALWSLHLTRLAANISAEEAKKSKTASEKAQEEVRKVRRDLKLVASIAGLERALTTLDDIKSFIRHSTFGPVPDRISLLIQYLNELRTPNQGLLTGEEAAIQSAVVALRKIESAIDSSSQDTNKKRPVFIGRISSHIDTIQPILTRLRDTIGSTQ